MVDLHLRFCTFTLKIDGVAVDIDIHGRNKNQIFWRLLTSATPNWRLVGGEHKLRIHLESPIDGLPAKAIKTLAKIKIINGNETQKLLSMPLKEMCKALILKAFIET